MRTAPCLSLVVGGMVLGTAPALGLTTAAPTAGFVLPATRA